MGALPKRKISKQRRGKRRAMIRLKLINLVICPNCGEKKRPHEACPNCGYYNKKRVLEIKTAEKKKKKST
jgi:large subunit ribosomal protein L32